ncbi:MAG TPA: CotH kinase family protein [Verrucomicrobiales bacterium]|nr:CotH kinase family protein [Verrucomicrobiales bacterium]
MPAHFSTPRPALAALVVACWTAFSPVPLLADVIIAEFLASNGGGLTDEDGENSDWIELLNTGPEAVDLEGFTLTDTAEEPGRWIFPARLLAGGERLLVFASGKDRTPEEGELHTNFRLGAEGEYLALFAHDPSTALSAFIPSFPPQQTDVSYGVWEDNLSVYGFFAQPTPGEPNHAPPPIIARVWCSPDPPLPGNDLLLMAEVEPTSHPLASVIAHPRVMFRATGERPMLDDGVFPDAHAGDGIYTVSIPHAGLFGPVFKAGEMIRWWIRVSDTQGNATRYPRFLQPLDSAEYDGAVVHDPSIETRLPVLHRFIENESAAETGAGTRASLYYLGEFYDNSFIRIRGGTARAWPRKSYKIELTSDHHFRFRDDVARVDEFNLNAPYTDKSYARAILTAEFHNDSGTPSPETFALRLHQNGEFFGVALFVEQPDRDFLRRHGMDPDGAYYKGNPGATYSGSTAPFEKKTRRDEGKEDLEAFLAGLKLTGNDLEAFLFDAADIPAQINYMAGIVLSQNIDASDKNHYLYRDTNGTGAWHMTPWDLDLTFGPDALNTDYIDADENQSPGATYPNASHPFIGSRDHTLHANKSNDFQDRIIRAGRTRSMLLRRIRTLNDQFLASGYFANRLDELLALIEPDSLLDRELWRSSSHFPGRNDDMRATIQRIKNEYLTRRRAYLESGAGVGIPPSQPERPSIEFTEVEFSPVSGNQDEEYLVLRNPNDFEVDLSGWSISGGIEFTFPAGCVLPRGTLFKPGQEFLYVAADPTTFRTRATGPSGGQGLFITGGFQGHLSSFGETLILLDDQGNVIRSHTYEGNPGPAQQFLVISEIFYHHPTNPEVEFIELRNIGQAALDLTSLRFTSGVLFDFSQASITDLAPGASVLVVRNLDAFEDVYGMGLPVAGEFTGGTRLANEGETIKLEDAGNNTIEEFRYNDGPAWPASANGAGRSLVRLRPDARTDPDSPASWRPSTADNGNPGESDSTPFETDDPLADLDGDGWSALAEYAFGTSDADPTLPTAPLSIRRMPGSGAIELSCRLALGADDVVVSWESSADGRTWSAPSPELDFSGIAIDGAGAALHRWQSPADAAALQFYRVRLIQAAGP